VIDQLKTHIPRYVAIAAAGLVALGFLLGGTTVGVGTVAGAVVAVADAWALTWLAVRVVSGAGFMSRGFAAALLGGKLFLLLGICWALLARFGVDPVGFCLGLGALVLGMLYGGAELSFKEAQAAREAQAAGEG